MLPELDNTTKEQAPEIRQPRVNDFSSKLQRAVLIGVMGMAVLCIALPIMWQIFWPVSSWSFVWAILVVLLVVMFGWCFAYYVYLSFALKKYYDFNKEDTSPYERMKYLFFRRYNSYSLTAYFVLLVSTLLLASSVVIFLRTDQLLILDDKFPMQYRIVTVSVTRIGVLSLAFFIGQVFLRLYRYNLAMANFYISHFDALSMKTELPNLTLKELVALLTPPSVLSKEEATPIKEGAELVKAINELVDKSRK